MCVYTYIYIYICIYIYIYIYIYIHFVAGRLRVQYELAEERLVCREVVHVREPGRGGVSRCTLYYLVFSGSGRQAV